VITPKIIYWSLAGIIIISLLFYLGFQVHAFARSPILFIDLPQNLTTEQQTIMIKGQTCRDAKLLLNNQEIIVNERGDFQEKIYLQEGLNILNFQAINSRNKTTYVTRSIYKLVN